MIFCTFLCMKGYPIYGADDEKNGCGPSKGYELKDDKSEPVKAGSLGSSSLSNSSSNSSNKNK